MEELQTMCLNNTNPVNVLRTPAEISLPKTQNKTLLHTEWQTYDVIALFLPPGALHNWFSLWTRLRRVHLSLVSPSRAVGVYKAAPCCLQCYLLKRVLMPHTHSCLFNPVHTFRTSQCVCCKDLHNQRRHELTLHVAQLLLMKFLKWSRNSVGPFHTLDAVSRKFEHKCLPMEMAETGSDNRPLDKDAFRFVLRVYVLSSVSVAWPTLRIYLCIWRFIIFS